MSAPLLNVDPEHTGQARIVGNWFLAGDVDLEQPLIDFRAGTAVSIEGAAIMPIGHYARLHRLAFPWWAFWRRRLKREIGVAP